LKANQSNLLEIFYLASFALFFAFNFIDRHVSGIFLSIALFLCLISYKSLYQSMLVNIRLVQSIIIFSVFISLVGFYHNIPLHELDNYYRFLLLLPLLLISLNERRTMLLIIVCAAAGLLHAIYIYVFSEINISRYQGTSSTAITYGNMCATLFMILVYYIIFRGYNSYYNILAAIIFLFLFILTGTRGPIIGLILSLVYLGFTMFKNRKGRNDFISPLIILFIFLISLVTIPNTLGERVKKMTEINLVNPLENVNRSFRERIFYIVYSKELIQKYPLIGIGPHNLESEMSQSLKRKNINNIFARDHLHNDFLDISAKFGLISLVLLLFIYFHMLGRKNSEHRVLLNIIMLMFISSQMTQSQFAHHQAITFFIVLLYLFQGNKEERE